MFYILYYFAFGLFLFILVDIVSRHTSNKKESLSFSESLVYLFFWPLVVYWFFRYINGYEDKNY
jgi:hypothetical protein